MVKWVVLAVVVLVLAAILPGIRERARPFMGPIPGWVDATGRTAARPMHAWTARNEAAHLARTLAQFRASGRPTPKPTQFQKWAAAHLNSDRNGLDPWGIAYTVRYFPDSVVVTSAGADTTMGTPDDPRGAARVSR